MTAPYSITYLAAYALTAARKGQWLAVKKALIHLQRDHGPEGVEQAMRGWCDTALASMPPTSGPIRWLWKDVNSGEISDNTNDLPPAQAWASRMLAARQALDIDTWEALMGSLPEGQSAESGECVLALLESTALTLDQNERQATS